MSQDASTVDVFDPKGKVRQVPTAQLDTALNAGGQKARKILSPKGEQKFVPESQYDAALAAGGTPIETLNPQKEGLYQMKGPSGSKAYGIPYSNVQPLLDQGYSFSNDDEQKRHDKDFKAAQPGLWEQIRGKVQRATEPIELGSIVRNPVMAGPIPPEVAVNVLKRTGRGLFGIVDFPVQYVSSAKKMLSEDPKISEEGEREIWSFHPGSQIAERIKEFGRDWKKDPSLAVANTAGDALTIYLSDKAAEVLKATPAKVKEGWAERAGTGPRSTRAEVADVGAQNRLAEIRAREIREQNDKIVAEAKTEAEKAHAAKVAEIRDKNAKSAAAHTEKVEGIVAENQGVHERAKGAHEEKLAEVRAKNEAATRAASEHLHASEEAHAAKVKEVEEKNLKAQEEHERAVEEKEKTEKRISEIKRRKLELQTRIFDRIKALQAAGKAYFDKQYNVVEEGTKNLRAPLNPLVDAIYDAKAEEIEGSASKLPIFDDMLKRAKGEVSSGADTSHIEGFDDLAPDEKAILAKGGASGVGEGISYKDLRGYDRELGKLIGSDGTPKDVRQAAIKVQKVLRKMQQDLANEAGRIIGATQKKLDAQYKNYAETFFDNSGPSGSGSPVAQAAKAEDAYNATEPFMKLEPHEASRAKRILRGVHQDADWVQGNAPGEAGAKGKTWRQYRWDTAKLVEELVRLGDEEKGLPKTNKELAPPAATPAPEFKLLPKPATGPTILPEPEFEPPTLEAKRLKAIPKSPEYLPEPEFKEPQPKLKDVPEPKKLSAEEMKVYKQIRLDKLIKKLQGPAVRGSIYGGLGGAVGVLAHYFAHIGLPASIELGAGASFLTDMGRKYIADFLSKPSVQEGLTKITAADEAELAKLPANQRGDVAKTMAALGQEAKRRGLISKTSPWVAFVARDRETKNDAPEEIEPESSESDSNDEEQPK